MTLQLPNQFTITCTADGVPAAGLLALVTLRMKRKNHYNIVVGPTDSGGDFVVQKGMLEQEATKTRELFPSDYAPLTGTESAFEGVIEVQPMSVEQIGAALRAYKLFGPTSYPTNYDQLLLNGHSQLVQKLPTRVDVKVGPLVSPATSSQQPLVEFITDSVPFPVAHLSANMFA
jgi:hypothetical protein